jgi:hypothetical protein
MSSVLNWTRTPAARKCNPLRFQGKRVVRGDFTITNIECDPDGGDDMYTAIYTLKDQDSVTIKYSGFQLDELLKVEQTCDSAHPDVMVGNKYIFSGDIYEILNCFTNNQVRKYLVGKSSERERGMKLVEMEYSDIQRMENRGGKRKYCSRRKRRKRMKRSHRRRR